MSENIKKLLELASGNEELKNRINSASKEELIAIAKENGIALSDADLEVRKDELSDDELNAVAGGKKCTCVVAGGGTGDGGVNGTCACVTVGWGNGRYDERRCECTAYGAGYDK